MPGDGTISICVFCAFLLIIVCICTELQLLYLKWRWQLQRNLILRCDTSLHQAQSYILLLNHDDDDDDDDDDDKNYDNFEFNDVIVTGFPERTWDLDTDV